MKSLFDEQKQKRFWQSLIRAANAEPREAEHIKGASGIEHPVLSVGVDDNGRRLIVISADADPRAAATAHRDIQAALPEIKVITARPIAIDLSNVAREISKLLGSTVLGPSAWNKFSTDKAVGEQIAAVFGSALASLEFGKLSISAQISQAIRQLSLVAADVKDRPKPS